MRGTGRLQQVEVLLQFQQPAMAATQTGTKSSQQSSIRQDSMLPCCQQLAMAATQTGIKNSQQQLNQALRGHMQLQDKVADFLMVAGALLAGHPPGRWTMVLAEISRPKSATTYMYDASSALRTGAAMSVWKISGNKALKSPVDCWMSRAELRDSDELWFQEPERVGWLANHRIFLYSCSFSGHVVQAQAEIHAITMLQTVLAPASPAGCDVKLGWILRRCFCCTAAS